MGMLWEKQSQSPSSGTAVKAGKMTPMPLPAKDNNPKDVHVVLTPLFDPQKKVPAFSDVKQAENIANCPVAAILAAYASTSVGRPIIQNMVTEKSGNVLTDLSGVKQVLTNPAGDTLTSARYFTVNLPGAVEGSARPRRYAARRR